MRYLLTGAQMKAIDQYSIQTVQIPSLVLMERAAMAVTEEILNNTKRGDAVLIAAGTGNNGADGLAIARMLVHSGYENVAVMAAGNAEKATEEWKTQKKILDFLRIPVFVVQESEFDEYINMDAYAVIVDALFGIGLVRNIEGRFAAFIDRINRTNAWKVAVDIASGISSDTGAVMNKAVKADLTVTFGYEKLGQVFYPGAEYSGRVLVKDIGFPASAAEQISNKAITFTKEDLKRLPVRPDHSNKGTFGKVLVIAGAKNMAGAAYLSASAAYAAGAGLCRILTVEENREILQQLLPEAVMTTYAPEHISWEIIQECLDFASVIVLGPGLSQADYAGCITSYVLENRKVPLVLDADAINLMAKSQKWCYDKSDDLIITPHLGEFSRLTGKSISELASDLKKAAEEFVQERGGILVCKDARTVVAQAGAETYVNTSGNSGMAKGGSGDVLTGIIAGLLAGGAAVQTAARLGVYIHGLAGDRAKEMLGSYSIKASDIIRALPDITKEGHQ